MNPNYRTRGRTLPGSGVSTAVPAPVDIADAFPVPEERLPANTRFPPRGRGHQDVTTAVPYDGTVSISQDTTSRPRVQSGKASCSLACYTLDNNHC